MTALRYVEPWTLSLSSSPEAKKPGIGEVVVDVHAVGICGTDIAILTGAYPARQGVVLGHEAAGVVAEIGEGVLSVKPGDRVVIDPTFHCGYCRMCRTNRQNHCEMKDGTESGVSRDGAFTPRYSCGEAFVHRVPDETAFEAAALAEPLSCALTGVARLELHLAHRVVVAGGGPLGVLYAWALATKGVGGTLIERSDARRNVSAAALPPGWIMLPSIEAFAERFAGELTPIDVAVDTTGALAERLLTMMARGGQLLAIGLKPQPTTVDAGHIADRSLSLLGSIDSLNNSFSEAVGLLVSGRVPASRIVTHRFALTQMDEALRLLGCDISTHKLGEPGAAIKVVVDPRPDADVAEARKEGDAR